jgi:hypothetical protein
MRLILCSFISKLNRTKSDKTDKNRLQYWKQCFSAVCTATWLYCCNYTVCEGPCGMLILVWMSMVLGPAASTLVRPTHNIAWFFIIDNSCVKGSGRGLIWRTGLKLFCRHWKTPKNILGRMSCVRIDICILALTPGQTARRLTQGADFLPLVKPL